LDDFHVEHAQEATAKAKVERVGGFRLEDERGIVELKTFQGFFEQGVIFAFGGVKAGEDHRLDRFIPGQGVVAGLSRRVMVSPTRHSRTVLRPVAM
jgi:hypothetical protein